MAAWEPLEAVVGLGVFEHLVLLRYPLGPRGAAAEPAV